MDNAHKIALHIVLSQIHEREDRKRDVRQETNRRGNAKQTTATVKARRDILALLGGKCARCGYDTDIHALQIDHIHGGGRQERLKFNSPTSFYRHILENPEGYQVLCANCNQIKKHENGEHGGGGWKKKRV